MLTLYSMPSSGNSYKARLMLAKTHAPFTHIEAENGSGVTRSAAFLALNPKGKVPLLVLEDGRTLSESNAILLYLAEGSAYIPDDLFQRAQMLAWMFWEQNAHEPVIAVRAGILTYDDRVAQRTPEILDPLLDRGHAVLQVMETALATSPYLTGLIITAADLCLYAYTHTAGERGGFEMERFPAVVAWLRRVADDEGHVELDWANDSSTSSA